MERTKDQREESHEVVLEPGWMLDKSRRSTRFLMLVDLLLQLILLSAAAGSMTLWCCVVSAEKSAACSMALWCCVVSTAEDSTTGPWFRDLHRLVFSLPFPFLYFYFLSNYLLLTKQFSLSTRFAFVL